MNVRNWDDWNLFMLNGDSIWRLIGAILVLIIGLWIANAVSKAVYKGLLKSNVDAKGRKFFPPDSSISRIISQVLKYFLILITLLIVLEMLNFSNVLNPFVGFIGSITSYIPHLLAAALLAAVAHILGTMLKSIVSGFFGSHTIKSKMPALVHYREVAGTIAYAIVILLFAPTILKTLQIPAISEPISSVINLIISYLPLLAGATILIIIGHLIAKFVARLASTLTASANLQRWIGDSLNASQFVYSVVYFLILFPIAVQALNLLQIESIRMPAQNILNLVMAWIPKILVAAFLLYLGYILAKIVRNLIITVLSPMGLDRKVNDLMPAFRRKAGPTSSEMGMQGAVSANASMPAFPLTKWIGTLIAVFVFGFFLVEATNVLDLGFISTTFAALMVMLPKVILVVIIVCIGIILAGIAERMISPSNPLKGFVQPVIIVLAVVIGLTEIGLGSIIITSGYLVVMIALAAAFIISVGIGSIPAVKRYWDKKQDKSNDISM
ncbi:mechanosensitive ion channel [Paenibacillus sp. FJAT-26967]|uniref:mechanosensitive ion channel n=1 Tax=Paenibacillus sp. FJAT-26967 TaxID=1729690 RepID=UPI000837BB88|nr:mechanosensitive ion channel [Paenibacillus sp. FJAT-26967]